MHSNGTRNLVHQHRDTPQSTPWAAGQSLKKTSPQWVWSNDYPETPIAHAVHQKQNIPILSFGQNFVRVEFHGFFRLLDMLHRRLRISDPPKDRHTFARGIDMIFLVQLGSAFLFMHLRHLFTHRGHHFRDDCNILQISSYTSQHTKEIVHWKRIKLNSWTKIPLTARLTVRLTYGFRVHVHFLELVAGILKRVVENRQSSSAK